MTGFPKQMAFLKKEEIKKIYQLNAICGLWININKPRYRK